MKQITITIETENAAFEPSWEQEAARLLSNLALTLRAGLFPDSVRDINGNRVGTVSYE